MTQQELPRFLLILSSRRKHGQMAPYGHIVPSCSQEQFGCLGGGWGAVRHRLGRVRQWQWKSKPRCTMILIVRKIFKEQWFLDRRRRMPSAGCNLPPVHIRSELRGAFMAWPSARRIVKRERRIKPLPVGGQTRLTKIHISSK
jgi:hypothetical protein